MRVQAAKAVADQAAYRRRILALFVVEPGAELEALPWLAIHARHFYQQRA